MGTTGQGLGDLWGERMRLIRLRRKKERPRFRDELKIVPRWLVCTVLALYVVAQIIALLVNLYGAANDGQIWPQPGHPVVSSLALAGVVTAMALVIATWLFLLGYVYRDARRRSMNAMLWTILCALLSWPFFLIGFLIYFQVREPLPYPCPRCANLVGPRFNFCPNCKCDL